MNPGDTISRYRIVGLIGRGGMGMVYRAEDTRLHRPVALKFLPPESFTERSKQRFLNEAHAAALARHPNICPIYDIEEVEGQFFIVMAFLEGETLHSRIARGTLPAAQVADIAAQIASGLACAHGLGIVHRDIKTANIMLDPGGHVSIMDFGLALSSDALRVTGEGNAVGTPAYMSPEQARGRAIDARTDIWSLGVVMFEMLTGNMPFHRDHRSALIHAILTDPAPDIATIRTGVPQDLQMVVAKALEKDPAARWQSAAEMAATLRGTPVSQFEAAATQTIVMPASPPRKRLSPTILAAAALLLLLGVPAGYRLLHTNPPAATAPAIPAVKQIAVLPFQVAAEADTVRSTADGVSDVLTSGLANIEGIAVVPAADIRRRNITAPEAARKFYGANLVVTGTAQQAGDQVEFTINLLDTVKAVTLDSRKFLYDPKNPLVSRDQIVTQTVRMMKLELPPAALTAIKAGDTNTPDAYSAYLEGRGFLARYDLPGNIDRAIAAFKKATKQDANYALAYAGLAEAYWRKARSSGDLQALTLANQNAEYAVGLDPNMAILHSVLGSVYTDRGKPEDAVREFQKAMELAPNNAEAPRQLAEVYKTQGRVAEAEALFLRSTKARPTDWYGHLLLGIFYYERERYPQAEAELNQAKSLTPDNDMVRLDLGTVYRMHGRYREAVEEFQQSLRIRPAASTFAALGGAYYYEHRFAEAVSALEAAIDLDSNDYRYWGNLGIYYRRTPGNEAKSTAALTKALEMATRFAGTKKSDMNVRADIAEYRARLGDTRGAIAEIDRIPAASRPPLTARLALVYQIAGDRAKAVAVIKANLKSPESLNQIKDDPDLSELWPDVKPG